MDSSMGILETIQDRLESGATTGQLVDEGYARSSVYAVAKRLAGKVDQKSKNRRPAKPKAGGFFDSSQSIPSRVSTDVEIASLQRQVTKARLEKELATAEGSTVSKEALAVYQSLKRQGYEGSVRDFVDEAVAATLLDCPEVGLAGSHRDWAVTLLSGQSTASRPDPEVAFDSFRSAMGQLARSKAIRMTPQS